MNATSVSQQASSSADHTDPHRNAALTGIVAVVVAGRPPSPDATITLADTLEAVASQTLRPDHVVIVRAGTRSDTHLDQLRRGLPNLPPSTLVFASDATNFGQAVHAGLANERTAPLAAQAQWLWLLHDDALPEPACVEELWKVGDRATTIGTVGPKQIDATSQQLLEFGIHASRAGRRLSTIAPGEIDQGQYDARTDVLAVGTVGMLVRRDVWESLGGIEPVLGPFGDGLEWGRRVRRAGLRVVVAPRARLRHEQASYAPNQDERSSYAARQGAQWFNWLLAEPWYLVVPVMVWLALSVPGRSLGHAVLGDGLRARAQWQAWRWALTRTPALVRARHRACRQATLPRTYVRPLEAKRTDFRRQRRLERRMRQAERRTGRQPDPLVASSLRRWRLTTWGTFALMEMVLSVVSLAIWYRMLPGFAGASWAGAPIHFGDLWHTIWPSPVVGTFDMGTPVDPALIPLAIVAAPWAMVGADPATVWQWLIILATPLAAASMWACAGRMTAWVGLRLSAALAWATLPTVTMAASTGRVAPVLFHIAAPLTLAAALMWRPLGFVLPVNAPADRVNGSTVPPAGPLVAGASAAVRPLKARRLGGGGVTLGLAILVSIAPWTLALLWLCCLGMVLRRRHRRGAAVLAVATIPAAMLVAPTVLTAASSDTLRALITTGGPPLAAGPGRSWTLLVGLPSAAGWIPNGAVALAVGAGAGALWVAAVGTVIFHAVRGRITGVGAVMVTTVAFLILAGVGRLVFVAYHHSRAVSADVTPALTLGALCLIVALARGLDQPYPWDDARQRKLWPVLALLGAGAAVSLGTWAWVGPLNAEASDHVHPAQRQIPAVIYNRQENGADARLLVVHGAPDGQPWDIAEWKGDGPLTTDASAITRAQALSGATDANQQTLTQALVTTLLMPDSTATQTLAEHHVEGILIPEPSQVTAGVEASLDRAPGVERVGDTDQGRLWRVHQTEPLPELMPTVDDAWYRQWGWYAAVRIAMGISLLAVIPWTGRRRP